jgi:hypothetical protein
VVDGEQGFQAAMANVLARHYGTILIDAPTGPLAVSGPRAAFQDRWRAVVATAYQKIETKGGWEFWQPKSPNP